MAEHKPVMLHEAITSLNIKPGGVYIDATFGRGGHSQEILKHLSDDGLLVVIDKDPTAINLANSIAANDARVKVFHDSFANLETICASLSKTGQIDGILIDLGVSSPQLDEATRGFSFNQDGPLDMRMDTSKGQTAADWLNSAASEDIAKVLKVYGEERFAKKIANTIVAKRATKPFETTLDLANLVIDVLPFKEKNKHPATRTFLAIRIFINGELDDLEQVLEQSVDLLGPNGRLVVISFHSLEDRIVKQFMAKGAKGDDFPPGLPIRQDQIKPAFRLVIKKQRPSEQEVDENVRARSATLRVVEKISYKECA